MMLKLSLAAIITIATALPAEGVDLSPRIAGGEDARPGTFSSMVSISIGGQHTCGGVLVGPLTVITAAHCGHYEYDIRRWKVRAGSLDSETGGTVVGVRSITRHSLYNEKTSENDIAAIELLEAIPESSSTSYGKLPQQEADPPAQADASIAGWGALREGTAHENVFPSKLQTAGATIVDRNACINQIPQVTDNQICIGASAGAGAKSRGRLASRAPGSFDWTGGPAMPGLEPWTTARGVCTGDSGSPVFVNGVVVGVLSFVLTKPHPKDMRVCQSSDQPAVATRVSKYIDGFIKAALQQGNGTDPQQPPWPPGQGPPGQSPPGQGPPDQEPQPPPDNGTGPWPPVQDPQLPPGQGPPGQGPQSCPPGCISLDSLFSQPQAA